ncbi:MAG TPA: hypothetical protein PK904_08635 [Bacteroidales bacterium]|nr:hypothetical protein [Bacteroidales bacterium]
MGHLKEPEGIDFIIQSPPLTDQERKEISDLIKKMKAKSSKSGITRKKKTRKEMAE